MNEVESKTKPVVTVKHPPISGTGSVSVTVKCTVSPDWTPPKILAYIRSPQFKQDFSSGWMRTNTPRYGLAMQGGPRPVFEKENDRESGVVAYEQDLRLTASI